MLESPFRYTIFPRCNHTVLLSKKIARTRRYNRNAGINFDKKTWRYRDNSQGIWGRKEGEGKRTESPKINDTVRHTAAGYDREIRAFKCKCNGPPCRSEDNRGRDLLLFTAIYFCAKHRVFRRGAAVPSDARLIHGEICIAILALSLHHYSGVVYRRAPSAFRTRQIITQFPILSLTLHE